MNDTRRDQRVCHLAREFLLGFEGVTQEVLDLHLSPDVRRPETMAVFEEIGAPRHVALI
jgi:hypothetical protein